MNDRFFTALFCDDVRQEIGNKLTLVGCYSGQLQLATIPATLPKLCVHITAATPRDNPFKQLTILVYKDDQELAKLEIPSDELAKASESIPGEGGRIGIISVLAFSPIQFEKPCILSVHAITEEGEFKGPRLQITQHPAPEITAAQ